MTAGPVQRDLKMATSGALLLELLTLEAREWEHGLPSGMRDIQLARLTARSTSQSVARMPEGWQAREADFWLCDPHATQIASDTAVLAYVAELVVDDVMSRHVAGTVYVRLDGVWNAAIRHLSHQPW